MKNVLITYKKRITLLLSILLVLNIITLRIFDTSLNNETCKNGIVSFELAKDLDKTVNILNSWNTNEKINVGLSLGFDFLFLFVYASLIALLIFNINERLWKNKSFYQFGNLLIFLIFTAAFLDVVENVSLIKLLLGNLNQNWSSIAYYAAIVKFSFVLICISYILINWIILLSKKTAHLDK